MRMRRKGVLNRVTGMLRGVVSRQLREAGPAVSSEIGGVEKARRRTTPGSSLRSQDGRGRGSLRSHRPSIPARCARTKRLSSRRRNRSSEKPKPKDRSEEEKFLFRVESNRFVRGAESGRVKPTEATVASSLLRPDAGLPSTRIKQSPMSLTMCRRRAKPSGRFGADEAGSKALSARSIAFEQQQRQHGSSTIQ